MDYLHVLAGFGVGLLYMLVGYGQYIWLLRRDGEPLDLRVSREARALAMVMLLWGVVVPAVIVWHLTMMLLALRLRRPQPEDRRSDNLDVDRWDGDTC